MGVESSPEGYLECMCVHTDSVMLSLCITLSFSLWQWSVCYRVIHIMFRTTVSLSRSSEI